MVKTQKYSTFGKASSFYDKNLDVWVVELNLHNKGLDLINQFVVKDSTESIDLGNNTRVERYLVKKSIAKYIDNLMEFEHKNAIFCIFGKKNIDERLKNITFEFENLINAKSFLNESLKSFIFEMLKKTIEEKRKFVCEILVKEKEFKTICSETEKIITNEPNETEENNGD